MWMETDWKSSVITYVEEDGGNSVSRSQRLEGIRFLFASKIEMRLIMAPNAIINHL